MLKYIAPLLQRILDRIGVGVIPVHGRIPDPHVEPVLIGQARHAGHHLQLRQWEMGAVAGVVRARRDELDGVAAEDGQVAIILLPLREVPGVVAIGLRSIAQLMAAQWIRGGRGNAELAIELDFVGGHSQARNSLPTPNSTPRESFPSTNTAVSLAVVAGADAVSFGAADGVSVFGQIVGEPAAESRQRRRLADSNYGRAGGGPLLARCEAGICTAGDFINEHRNRFVLADRRIRRYDDDSFAQVECIAAGGGGKLGKGNDGRDQAGGDETRRRLHDKVLSSSAERDAYKLGRAHGVVGAGNGPRTSNVTTE